MRIFFGELAVGDVDGDGDVDVVVHDTNTTEIEWIESGLNGFTGQAVLGTSASFDGMAVGDFDGDGDGDVVVADGASASLVQHQNPLF